MKGLFFFVIYVFDCASVIIKFMYELIKYITSRVKEKEKQRITKYVTMNFLKGAFTKFSDWQGLDCSIFRPSVTLPF